MYNLKKAFVPIFILLLDFALVIVSFLIGYLLRYGVNIPKASLAPFKECFLALGLIYVLAFAFVGLFHRRFSSHWQLAKKASHGMVTGTLFSFVLYLPSYRCFSNFSKYFVNKQKSKKAPRRASPLS